MVEVVMIPTLQGIDHVHVFVEDRAAAERWYGSVLGLRRAPELEVWAADGGPLTLQDASGSIHIALFERPAARCRSTIALRVRGEDFGAWRAHLDRLLPGQVTFQDHDLSLSLYFADPDGNPYEITTYDTAVRG
jgi:catechol 2,3-dioxygenase-like lactoylglutathione lyase family enzyme